jgi:hypothetical protein
VLRFAWGLLASAAVLLGSAALGLIGAWVLAPSAVLATVGAVVAVVVMEARDLDVA